MIVHLKMYSLITQAPYVSPEAEVLECCLEQCILSGEDGSHEPVGYDDDPFGGGNG